MKQYVPEIKIHNSRNRTIKLQIGKDKVLSADLSELEIKEAGIITNEGFLYEVGGAAIMEVARKQNQRFNRFIDIINKDMDNWNNKTGIYAELNNKQGGE